MKKLKTDTSYDEQVTQNNDDPTYVDWRTRNAVTPVKDQVGGHLQGGLETVCKSYVPFCCNVQGQCGASYAFSAIASIEGAHALAHEQLRNLSEQNIIDCSGNGSWGLEFRPQ